MPLRIEGVPLASWRGLLALILVGLLLAVLLVPSSIQLVEELRDGDDANETFRLTQELLVAELAFNWLLFAGVPMLYLVLVRPRESPVTLLGLRLSSRVPLDLLWGGLAALVAIVALVLLALGLDAAGLLPREESPLVGEFGRLIKQNPALIAAIAVTAGVTEEILFRGLLQPRIGIIASSLLFGFVHIGYGTVMQVVGPLLLGVYFAVLYRRTGTLWIPVAAHTAFNAVQLTLLYLAPDASAPAVPPPGIGYL